MSEQAPTRKFQVKDLAILEEDIFTNRPGQGLVLYAYKGEVVTVMSYDPSADKQYGVRAAREGYLNAPITGEQARPYNQGYTYASTDGL